MKQLVLIGIMAMCGGPLLAQRALYKPQVHEISLQAGSAQLLPGYEGGLQAPGVLLPPRGLLYTYHYSITHGVRAGAQVRRLSLDYQQPIGPYETYQATTENLDFRLGYVYNRYQGPVRLHAGVEGRYSLGQTEQYGVYAGSSNFNDRSYKTGGLGGAAFAGYSFFVGTHLSLGMELSAHIMPWSQRRYNLTDVPTLVLPNPDTGFDFSVYINYHTVKMKKRCTCPRH
ncbi:MAG: hypothetical protein SF053_16600 [Bacteroidia bacterium]|nr:hypothetical protein [Bacteroidia bacterium]